MSPKTDCTKEQVGKDLRDSSNRRAAPRAASSADFAPDLAAVVDAWDRLPAAVKAGIVAMVNAATAGEGET